jgi:hypothetical protein
VQVAHGCNPSYPEGKDQPSQIETLSWEKNKQKTKKPLVMWLKV